ncbi:O-antigen ligase family protein [Chryseobacterium gossypii]|uniref:O-antigen ligase family protein n=1 Tax=Chryseobacterium gossypii TaxID=3231602 RepID=UPI003525AD2A
MQIKKKLYNFYVIFSLAGFLISSFLPSMLGIEGNGINILYRVLVLLLSIFILLINISSKSFSLKILNQYQLFIIFWVFYSFFLLKDIYYAPVKLAPNKTYSEYVQFAFGVVLIPCLALIVIDSKKLNFKTILNTIYYTIYILLLGSLISRSNSNITGRNVGDLEIGVLVYGQYGTMLALLSIYKLVTGKNKLFSIIYILGIAIGTLTIFVSASRSPFIALILSTIYFFIMKKGTKGVFYLSIPAFFIGTFFFEIMDFFGSLFKSNFLQRLASTFEKDNEREKLYNVALNEFMDHPFLGKHFVIQTNPYMGSYPHNLFIEGFMATGFFIGMILVILFLRTILIQGKFVIQKDHFTGWIPMILCQFFIFSMFSNNIYSNNLLWYSLILTLISFKYEKLCHSSYPSVVSRI